MKRLSKPPFIKFGEASLTVVGVLLVTLGTVGPLPAFPTTLMSWIIVLGVAAVLIGSGLGLAWLGWHKREERLGHE